MTCCQICSSLGTGDAREVWNRPLLETDNFVVVPSLGSMVEGWLLIFPKDHYICMGAMPAALISELEDLKNVVKNSMNEIYGVSVAFEHGPANAGRKVGCTVDHAHLHLVPLNVDLISRSEKYIGAGRVWVTTDLEGCRDAHNKGNDYLYAEDISGHGSICQGMDLGSQVFRKVIADTLGISDLFNWRENLFIDNIQKTVQKFRTIQALNLNEYNQIRAC